MNEKMLALGLMSGTSLDGIDAALIETDGQSHVRAYEWLTVEYDDEFRCRMRALLSGEDDEREVEKLLTEKHAEAVQALLAKAEKRAGEIGVIGFHGQTVKHDPANGITRQIGDGKLLAQLTGIDVVNDFRSNDVKHGGNGAPLVPLYHAALSTALPKPVAIVNIGGVSNVTWIGDAEAQLLAMDTGTGVALVNDYVYTHSGEQFDRDGQLAFAGVVDQAMLEALMEDPFFRKAPPKSLDRNHFRKWTEVVHTLPYADAVATLTAFTTEAIIKSTEWMPVRPQAWYVCGGGRLNPAIMHRLNAKLHHVHSVDDLGWDGDALEAQAFAYLAVRSLKELPLSLPGTTGVNEAVTGGRLHSA